MTANEEKSDPQQEILNGRGAFGVEYVPKSQRAPVVDGRVFAGKAGEFSPGKGKAVHLDRFSIAVFRVGEEFYAIKDACPHAAYPLHKGLMVSEYVVMCNSHNWRFDVRDGRCVQKGCGHQPGHELAVRTFAVDREGEEIWIRLS